MTLDSKTLPSDSQNALDFDSAIKAIEAAKSIVMACHINPDGDALGSLIAMGEAIKQRYPGKSITILSRDGIPEILKFLPGSHLVQQSTSQITHDLAIVLDSGELKRVGEQLVPIIQAASVQMDIDHHVGEGAFGTVRVLDSTASATAEIVFDLIEKMGVTLTDEIATCLLTGVITDTGSFRFMNVTPRTLRIAAALTEAGASPAAISESVFDNKTYAATKLIGLSLSTLNHTPDGKVSWAHVRNEDFVSTGATDEDTEGLINHVRAVRGTEIAILFREIRMGLIRISLRCIDGHDVSLIANQFEGGGHRMAAGCSFRGTAEDAQAALVAACVKALGE
jgi:phosphoesterase RecJ-like protein